MLCGYTVSAPGEKLLMLTRCHISEPAWRAKLRGCESGEKADLFFVLFATYAYIVLGMYMGAG